jgi:hypothetical protein
LVEKLAEEALRKLKKKVYRESKALWALTTNPASITSHASNSSISHIWTYSLALASPGILSSIVHH